MGFTITQAPVILLKRNLAGVVVCVLVFLVVGPAIGLIGGLLPIVLWETGSLRGVLYLPHVLPVAYVIGGPSALTVGIVYCALACAWPAHMRGLMVRVAVGTVLGAAGAGVIAGLITGLDMSAAIGAGVAAGAVCALLVGFEVPHPGDTLEVTPDKSFERTRES